MKKIIVIMMMVIMSVATGCGSNNGNVGSKELSTKTNENIMVEDVIVEDIETEEIIVNGITTKTIYIE